MQKGIFMNHLHKVIAVEKDVKEKALQCLVQAKNIFGQRVIFSGLVRVYTPKDEMGDQLPPESTRVQYTVEKALKEVQEKLIPLFDIVATKDWANCVAKADIVVDDQTLMKDVPATYILFLEKYLGEILAFVKSIPILDAAEQWEYDVAKDVWVTPPVETIKSKKIMRNHVLSEATQHHPAQVHTYTEDVAAGTWKTIKYSGAYPAGEYNALITRIEKLQKAVKFAREQANRQDVTQQHVGEVLLQYIFV